LGSRSKEKEKSTLMHMADALISPLVGGAMGAVAAVAAGTSVHKVQREADDRRVPLMGVIGAFVFAAQMINFSIPGTGSSGHLGGGLLLAALLGPYAGFLSLAAVLILQALFFADGGLLALGCNLVNLGVMSCFVAYPLIYRPLTRGRPSSPRLLLASVLAAVLGLQLGAFGVVAETTVSGVSGLPFGSFLLLMQPIHLAIGLVEGLVTASILIFLRKARPELLAAAATGRALSRFVPLRRILAVFAAAAFLLAFVFVGLASADPDGLEWAVARLLGRDPSAGPAVSGLHAFLADLQQGIALFPDYALRPAGPPHDPSSPLTAAAPLLGTGLALLLVAIAALALAAVRRRTRRARPAPPPAPDAAPAPAPAPPAHHP